MTQVTKSPTSIINVRLQTTDAVTDTHFGDLGYLKPAT